MLGNLYASFWFMYLYVGLEFQDNYKLFWPIYSFSIFKKVRSSETISYKYGMNYFGVWVYYVISSYNIHEAINQYRYWGPCNFFNSTNVFSQELDYYFAKLHQLYILLCMQLTNIESGLKLMELMCCSGCKKEWSFFVYVEP